MRLAKCVGLTAPVTVIGSRTSVVVVGPTGQPGDADYHPGWEGDLGQVLGESGGKPFTLAEGLGPHVQHFVDVNPAAPASRRAARSSEAPAVASQE